MKAIETKDGQPTGRTIESNDLAQIQANMRPGYEYLFAQEQPEPPTQDS